MPDHDLGSVSPDRLAPLLQMSDGGGPLWSNRELAAIFRHQLSVAIEYDLGSLPAQAARVVEFTASAQGLLLKSFADLLGHPNPPLELLKQTKEFAKAHRNQPDNPLPREVSTLLYYASIAAALLHGRQRITTLDDRILMDGFGWAAGLEWIDECTRRLFVETASLLKGEGQP